MAAVGPLRGFQNKPGALVMSIRIFSALFEGGSEGAWSRPALGTAARGASGGGDGGAGPGGADDGHSRGPRRGGRPPGPADRARALGGGGTIVMGSHWRYVRDSSIGVALETHC